MKNKLIVWIFVTIILLATALAANDPGHDTLYIEEDGDSDLNGSFGVLGNLTAYNMIFSGTSLDVRGDGVLSASSNNQIIGAGSYLSIQSLGNIYINTLTGTTSTVFLGDGADSVNLNITGTLEVGGQGVCLADGTNCLNGGAGNVTSVTAAAGPLSASPTTGAVIIDITVPTCTGSDKLTYDGSSFSCEADQTGSGDGTGGWTANAENTTTTLNVGIGTTSPQRILHVIESSSGTSLYQANSLALFENNGNYRIGIHTSNIGIGGVAFADPDDDLAGDISYYHNGDYMRFYVNNSERMRINGQGNVGIGTTNPGTTLDVAGSINATGDICITGGNCLSTVSAGGSGGAGWTNTSTTTSTSLNVSVDSGTLFVDSTNNNVGIGTSSPGGLLDVTFGTNNHITFQNTSTGNADDFVTGLGSIGFSRATDGALGLAGIYAYEGTDGATQPNLAIGARGDLVLVAGAAGNVFSANEIVRIDGSSGNVGIGTTSPDSELHVIGGLCVESSDSSCDATPGTVTATTFTGDLTGNADTATTANDLSCSECVAEGEITQNTLDDSEIATGGIGADSLAANSVDASELVSGAVTSRDVYPTAADDGRIRMAQIGCAGSWDTSCDAGNNGYVDYADNAGTLDSIDSTGFVQTSGAQTRSGNLNIYGTDTSGVYSNAPIEIREVNLVTTGQTSWAYAPALAFHWGGRTQTQLKLLSDGSLALGTADGTYTNFMADDIILSGEITGSGSSDTYGSITIDGSKSSYSGIHFEDVTGSGDVLMVHNTAGIQGFWDASGGWDWYFDDGILTAGSVPAARLTSGTSGTGAFTFPTSVTSAAFYYSSDERLKKDINQITGAVDLVNQLEGVSFKWNETNESSIGLIAQDVEKIIPEIVTTGGDGYKSIQYGNLVAVLIEAVKEQQAEIEDLRREIDEIKTLG
jgi:hypothetical protein